MKQPPTFEELHTPQPFSEWHEDYGAVMWHHMPIDSPPHCGCPLSSDWPWEEEDEPHLWWTPLPDCNQIHDNWERLTICPQVDRSPEESAGEVRG